MQCPRCGYKSGGAATTCPRCGLQLSSYDINPGGRQGQLPGGFETSQTIDGIWREDDSAEGNAGDGSRGDGPPSWLMRALGASGQTGRPDMFTAPTSQPHSPPSGFAVPPTFTRDAPPNSGAAQQSPFPPYNWESEVSNPLNVTPFTSATTGGYASFLRSGQNLPPGNMSLAPLNVAGSSGQLAPGTSLKGGRYRILQPFYHSTIQLPRNEPPLMIASDAELPDGRVLVQEVLLNGIRPEESDNARRFVAQRLLSLSTYPVVPRLIDHFGQQWRHFLVFEFPAGDLLLDRLQRAHAPLPEPVAVRLALQVAEILEIFEGQLPPFIHGNLSPANLILRPSGHVVVVGCSPHLLLYPDGAVDNAPAGGIAGYGAPEQLRGQATPRSDIYALCAILYHAVTGVAPAPRANAPHPPARRLNPRVSLELEEILARGLRPSAMQRYHTATELHTVLEPLVSGQVTHVPEELDDRDPHGSQLVAVRDARGHLVLPRQRRLQNPLFLLGVILALIVLIGGAVLFAASPHPFATTAMPTTTPNNQVQTVQQQDIGLSDGEFSFDTPRLDSSYKTEGARYLASGDLAHARSAFLTAISVDPSDAEAAIYAEDLQVSLSQAPFVTIVVGTAFGLNANPVDVAAARSELEGVYLAQQHINSGHSLPDGVRVRVMILNSGLSVSGATTAANVLLQELNKGNAEHVVGIIGWPESAQTERALSLLKPSGIPLVSPTGSDSSMTNSEASLFRLVPLDTVQAQDLADVAVEQMGAIRVAVLFDPGDQLSNSMASSFISRLTSYEATTAVREYSIRYTSDAGTNFASIAEQAVLHDQANVIYLSTGAQGGDVDSIDLAGAVVAASQSAGVKTPPILVDSRAYTPAFLGIGGTSAANLIQKEATPAIYADLYVETLADMQEWTFLKLPGSVSVPDTFNSAFSNQYQTDQSPDEWPVPNATIILSYDSLDLLVAAGSSSIGRSNGAVVYPTLAEVRDGLLAFSPARPFIGISGAISYDQTGDLNGDLSSSDTGPSRGFGILEFVPFVDPLADGQLATPQVMYVAGEANSFCGGTVSCSPSPV